MIEYIGVLIGLGVGFGLGYLIRKTSYDEQRMLTYDFIDKYNEILKDKEIQQLKDTIIRLEKELTDKETGLDDIIRSR